MSFSEYGLSPEILDGIRDMGYSQATPIQKKAIPVVLTGRDVVASAQTGTGKTAAFVVPILEKIRRSGKRGLQCLILSPTRELAQQIDEQIFAIGYYADIPSVTIYGGGDWGEQQKALEKGVSIIVATPGRLLDLIKVRNIDFSQIDTLVLDEADRMLDMGFIPDVRTIINRIPKNRQTLFFSATIHDKLKPLLDEFLNDPFRIEIAPNRAAKSVNQWLYFVDYPQKPDLIRFLLQDERFPSAIVFTSTKRGADELSRELRRKRLAVASIHGDRTQQEREDALDAFKRGDIRVLVATDVLARGIDIDEVSLVINYDVPREVEDYIHRIGRTGRADAKGDAITLVAPQDRRYLDPISKVVGKSLILLDLPEEIRFPSNDRPRREEHVHQSERKQDDRGPRPEQNHSGEEQAPRPPRERNERQAPPKPAPKPEEPQDVTEVPASEDAIKPARRRSRGGRNNRAKKDSDTTPDIPQNDVQPTKPESAAESEPDVNADEVSRPPRRRSRGGRNRRRGPRETDNSVIQDAPETKPAPAPRERQPRLQQTQTDTNSGRERQQRRPRPVEAKPDAETSQRTDQRRPVTDSRKNEDRPPRQNNRRNGQGQGNESRPQRGTDNRGGQQKQRNNSQQRRPNAQKDRIANNDLSNMSTTLKGQNKSQQPAAESKGVFGFIKKLFGRD